MAEATVVQTNIRQILIPGQSAAPNTATLYTFNTDVFNDSTTGSSYYFKAEDIIADRVPTIRRVIITYRNLGVATLTITLTGIDDNGAVVTNSITATLGSVAANGNLLTYFGDITLTAFRPQLSITRAANGGPIAISTIVLVGRVEQQDL